jgi:hypothetical protein
MKIYIKTTIILSCLFVLSCVMESPLTYYSFTIKNSTNTAIVVESKTIDDNYIRFDTLNKGQAINRKILQLQCFADYKDTLIRSFFKNLKLSIPNKSLYIDPLNRKNWNENLESLTGSNCKSGTCFYSLTINEKEIK